MWYEIGVQTVCVTCTNPVNPRTICWKYCFFHNILHSLLKYQLTIDVWIYFQTLYSAVWICVSVPLPVPQCFDQCSLVVSFETRKCESPKFILVFQDCFVYSGPLDFHINFRFRLSIFPREAVKLTGIEILIGITLNL